jgi:hypothetical protein
MTNLQASLIAAAVIIAGVLLAQHSSNAQSVAGAVAITASAGGGLMWVAYGGDSNTPVIWRCLQEQSSQPPHCDRVSKLNQ